MWQSLVTISQATSEVTGGEKRKKKKEINKLPQQNRMAGSASTVRPGGHNKLQII